ncbi:MAG: restriction endonuclease [Candidatus Absconditabacteria bacterium]|nr:restriction endonuclease [Candidatus Absconditabacteria bacterium]
MNYSDYIDIRKIISLLFLFGLLYLLKLFLSDGLFGFWLFGLIVGLYALLVFFFFAIMDKSFFNKQYGYSKLKDFYPKTIIEKLKAMHPKDFEDFIKLLFELRGYKIIYKSFWKKYFSSRIAKKDGGIDLIVVKDGKKIYVQIKKKNTDMIGVEVMRSFYGAIVNKLKGEDKLLLITTSIFSEDAEKFAKENNIEIMSYKEIEQEIDGLEKDINNKQKIVLFLSRTNYYSNKYNQNIRTCPKCGAPLKWRKEGFYGCQNYYKTGCDYKEYK